MKVIRNLLGRDALSASRHFDELKSGSDTERAWEWARKSKKNVKALMQVAIVSEIARQSDVLRSLDLTELARAAQLESTPSKVTKSLRVAACVLIVVLGGVGFYFYEWNPTSNGWTTYSTIGMPGTFVSLADGSGVEMASDTVFRARTTGTERAVLLDAGEASFDVRHLDSAPVFRVRSRDLIAEVRGTRFTVKVTDEQSSVGVSEGVVEVRGTESGAAVHPLRSGEGLAFVRHGVSDRSTPGPDEVPVDKAGRSLFRKTPLSEVALAFNRATTIRRVIVIGPAQAQTLTAAIHLDDPDKLAQILERRPELLVRREGNDVVITMKGDQ